MPQRSESSKECQHSGKQYDSVDRGLEQALRVYRAVPQFGRLREQVLLNDVWQLPELTARDRRLVTCSVLERWVDWTS